MEITANDLIASIVFLVLYALAILTVIQLLIGSGYKLPKKLQWMNRILDVPYLGAVAHWFFFLFTGKKKEKRNSLP
jgi:hypothetical protein